jgi:hypothetical protein
LSACVTEIAWGTVECADRAKARPDKVERFECASTVGIWMVAEVVVVEDEQIERDERDIPATGRGQVRPEPIEVTRSAGVGDEFSIEHQSPTEVGEDLQVFDPVGDVTAGAGPYCDRTVDVTTCVFDPERATGIEPAFSAWEANRAVIGGRHRT